METRICQEIVMQGEKRLQTPFQYGFIYMNIFCALRLSWEFNLAKDSPTAKQRCAAAHQTPEGTDPFFLRTRDLKELEFSLGTVTSVCRLPRMHWKRTE